MKTKNAKRYRGFEIRPCITFEKKSAGYRWFVGIFPEETTTPFSQCFETLADARRYIDREIDSSLHLRRKK